MDGESKSSVQHHPKLNKYFGGIFYGKRGHQAETVSLGLTKSSSVLFFYFSASESGLVDQICFIQHQQVQLCRHPFKLFLFCCCMYERINLDFSRLIR